MPHSYSEDQLVKQPAIGLLAEMGWAVAGPPPNAGVGGELPVAGIAGHETHGERGWFPDSTGRWTTPTPLLPFESLLIAPNHWAWALDPYWTHTGLMVDPSANLSA